MSSLRMDWSATSATRAYLDTIKLCNYDIHKRRRESKLWKTREPGTSEFVSALAAGMRAKLIVEVTTAASPSTIALAAAARQTGGRLVCIVPEAGVLTESKRVIKDSGLKDLVEFEAGDPTELLPRYPNVDFSLVNCCGARPGQPAGPYARLLLRSIDVNPRRSVVVARSYALGLGGACYNDFLRGVLDEKKVVVRSVKQYPIGIGMEVITMIESGSDGLWSNYCLKNKKKNNIKKKKSGDGKSKWVAEFDEESGEEHIFRVSK